MLIAVLLVTIFSIPLVSPKFFLILIGVKEMLIKGFDSSKFRYPILLFLISLCLYLSSQDYSEYRVLKLTTIVFLATIFSRFFWTKLFKSNASIYFFIVASIFFIVVRFVSTMESIPEFTIMGNSIFRGSYHNIWFIGLILLFQKSIKSKLSVIDVSVFLGFSILSTGRTPIILGSLIFLWWLIRWFKTSRFRRIVWLIFPPIFILLVTLSDVVVRSSKGLSERGFELTARQFIYGCYVDNLKYEDLLFGFHPNDIAKECLIGLGREDEDSKIVMTESSLLSLISYLGIFSLIPLARLITIVKEIDPVSRVVFASIIFRSLTGDFLFFTFWDFIWITGTKYYYEDI